MTLAKWIGFDSYYRGLKANHWPKVAAAQAARRHVNRMTERDAEKEAARINPANS